MTSPFDNPMLFDDVDQRNAVQQATRGYYFYEWISAATIYETTGYLSLVGKYASESHPAKRDQFNKTAPAEIVALMTEHERFGKTLGPDLFVYQPGKPDWFFVEAKGPTDKLRRSQAKLFEELENVSERQIKVARFCRLRARKR